MADYATVVLSYLAAHPQEPQSAAQVAEKTRISAHTVAKLLKQLVDARLVVSQRGINGGYQLARPAQTITVAEMVTAIDGAPALTECGTAASCCVHEAYCGMRGHWRKINRRVVKVLEEMNLEEMRE